MRKRNSKAEAERKHFKRRMIERLGVEINRQKLRELLELLHTGQLKFVHKQSNRISWFEAEIEGQIVHLVYDKDRKTFVTVLYPEKDTIKP
jgi:hypothetical protein